MHNILTPALLFEGVAKTLGKNEKAMQFQVDRSAGSTLDTKSVGKLSSMSHREYVYDEECVFEALLLRQHTGLGAGLRVEAPSLRKPSALPFKPPKLLGEAGVTCQPVFNADGARMTAATAAAAADAARAAKGGAPGGGCSGAAEGAGGGAGGGGAAGGAAGGTGGAAGGGDEVDEEEVEENGSDARAQPEDDTREVRAWLVLYEHDEEREQALANLGLEKQVHERL